MVRKGGWQDFSSPASTARPVASTAATPKGQQRVRVQRTRTGNGGKMVTTVSGLESSDAEARDLLKWLKAGSGTGGTLNGVIELHGDQVAAILALLEKEGFRAKQAGG